MKRIWIALSVVAVGFLGGAIGYHWSAYTSPDPPAVERIFSGKGAVVYRVDMTPSKEQYVYSLVARVSPCAIDTTADTPTSGPKPPQPETQDRAVICTKNITERMVCEHLYAKKGDLTPKELVVSVGLHPSISVEAGPSGRTSPLSWSWSDPHFVVTCQIYVMEKEMWWNLSQVFLPLPARACHLLEDKPPASGYKWKDNELVILKLNTNTLDWKRLTNIDIVLIRKPLGN